MRKIILTYGLIAGMVVSAMMWITMPMHETGVLNYDNGMLVGYTTMVISLSAMFFAIRSYRDQVGGITFGKAFVIGLLITTIASLLYAVSWEIYFHTQAPDFAEQYAAHYIKKVEQSGAPAAEVAQAKADMAESTAMYQNPVIRFTMTLAEIFPVGVLLALIAAAFLRKKPG